MRRRSGRKVPPAAFALGGLLCYHLLVFVPLYFRFEAKLSPFGPP
jgi:hypothetical protein